MHLLRFTPLWYCLAVTFATHGRLLRKCDPLSDMSCQLSNRALSSTIFDTFSRESPHFETTVGHEAVYSADQGLQLSVSKSSPANTLVLYFYIMYGRVEVDMRAARGRGVVSSVYLESDQHDTISIENAFGGNNTYYETSYLVKGETSAAESNFLGGVSSSSYHRYGVEWNPRGIKWLRDGRVVRFVNASNPLGIPGAPMLLELRLSVDKGAKVPSACHMFLRNLYVSDYSTGREYVYGNTRDGGWSKVASRGGHIHRGMSPQIRFHQTGKSRRIASQPGRAAKAIALAATESEQDGVSTPSRPVQAATAIGLMLAGAEQKYGDAGVGTVLPHTHQEENGVIPIPIPIASATHEQNTIYRFVQSAIATSTSAVLAASGRVAPKTVRGKMRKTWQVLPADRIPFPISVIGRRNKVVTDAHSGQGPAYRARWWWWVVPLLLII